VGVSMLRALDIGLIADSRNPIREPFAGGLEAHTHALATGLRARGHRVTIYASDASDAGLGVVPVHVPGEQLRLSGRARSDTSMPDERFMQDHHAYLDLMLRLRSTSHEVLHNNSLHYLPVAMAPSLSLPVVTVLHTPPTPWIESAAQCTARAGSEFVSVSQANARAWRHSLKVRAVVANGVDLDVWRPGRPADPPYAVWTGRLVSEKAPHLAIEAARRAGLALRIAGPTPDPHYFEREVKGRLGGGIVHLGHLSRRELVKLVGGARVSLVTPCWDEPYGLVVAESLACGTPVAGFARGAIPEILDERCGRLAEPDDIAGLARAATEAMRLRREDCRRRAENSCSLDAMVRRYEALYFELAA
jgi:glycosyltransferase involved in cell wall biosynthesis